MRSGLAVLALLTVLSVSSFGLASAALLDQADLAQRALVTTLARGFAAGFEPAQLERPSELRRRVDSLRDLHPELREATIVAAIDGPPSVLASTSRGREGGPVAPREEQPIGDASPRYSVEGGTDEHVAKLAFPLRSDRAAPSAAISLSYDLSAQADALAGRQRRLAVMIGIATLLFALLGWALLARDVFGTLARIHAVVRRTRAGERGARVGSSRGDEIGALAREIDGLATDLEATDARVEELTRHDPLTGLLNYRGVEDSLAAELDRAKRWGYRVAVVSVDVDDLAQINAGWGEDAGDDALRLVGDKMASDLRPGDLCARIGEDEFMLALTQTGGSEAEDVVHRVRAAVADVEFVPANRSLTISAGISQFPYDAAGPVELMRLAQRAMRRSKLDGGDRCTVYTPETDSALYV